MTPLDLNIGRNIKATLNGNELVLRVALDKPLGESSKGKSILLATTGGNVLLPNGARLGLNVFTPKEEAVNATEK